MNEKLIVSAIVLLALSGLPGLLFPRKSNGGQILSACAVFLGAVLGIRAALPAFRPDGVTRLSLPGAFPLGGIALEIDALSAAFLIPVLLLAALVSLYGIEYWKQSEHPENGNKLRIFFGLMTAGMALLVIARSTSLFLVAWETMALAGYFVLTAESDRKEVREAGWIYFAATHVSTLLLFAFFALYNALTGSTLLEPIASGALTGPQTASLFLLALAGFGIKAGLFPLHVWLPSAHANAPSHISAFFSGIFIKMGVYGMMRICGLLPLPPLWWGMLLLILGALSGILGVAFAIGQHDLKRLLAYHSIENIGIIYMGLGLAMIGRATDQTAWIVLGLSGSLLHVWNHCLFKALLFFSAGSVIHNVHTREIDHLGGLAKPMPYTAALFLIGSVAICGLPPLNGFVSELFIYLGLFHAVTHPGPSVWVIPAFAAPALALVGGLALLCFVKVYGAVFLGEPRTTHASRAHESGWCMLLPMAVLAVLCFAIGLFPGRFAPLFDTVVLSWTSSAAAPVPLASLAPLSLLTGLGLALVGLTAAGVLFLRSRLDSAQNPYLETWSCGYTQFSPRIQYTSSSFAQMMVDLFAWALMPKRAHTPVQGLFPRPASFHTHVPDTVLDRVVHPFFEAAVWFANYFRFLQQGRIQAYLLYIFLTLIALLLLK